MLKTYHILMIIVITYILYILLGNQCQCGNGFQVGIEKTPICNKKEIYQQISGCDEKKASECGKYFSGGWDDGNYNCILYKNKCTADSKNCIQRQLKDKGNIINGQPLSFKSIVSYYISPTPSYKSDIISKYGEIEQWDTSNITDMSLLFFNKSNPTIIPDITNWDTSNVTTMDHMFSGALQFNRDISGWNVSKVTNMSYMFDTADDFNQNISGWNVSSVKNSDQFCKNSGLSSNNIPEGLNLKNCRTIDPSVPTP